MPAARWSRFRGAATARDYYLSGATAPGSMKDSVLLTSAAYEPLVNGVTINHCAGTPEQVALEAQCAALPPIHHQHPQRFMFLQILGANPVQGYLLRLPCQPYRKLYGKTTPEMMAAITPSRYTSLPPVASKVNTRSLILCVHVLHEARRNSDDPPSPTGWRPRENLLFYL